MIDFLRGLTPRQLLPLIWLAVNVVVFLLYAYDKLASKTGRVSLRISERALFIYAAIFGAAGALGAMLLFRHKTRHRNFMLYIPAMLVVQLAVLIWLWLRILPR